MAEPNPTPEQEDEEAWTCFRLKVEGYTLREIEKLTGIPRETVRRRIELIMGQEMVSRDILKATATARLNYYSRRISDALEAPESDVAKLSHAGVAVEKRIAALHGLDEPTRAAVNLTRGPGGLDAPEGEGTPDIAAVRWAKAYKESALYERNGHNNGGPPIG